MEFNKFQFVEQAKNSFLAKNIVSESQTVGEHLRNKDIENIERILSEYEHLLQDSLMVINSQYHTLENDQKSYEEI